ncbi:hypothetical protein ACWD26_38600 [Streptomyces sp. NPDC002787]
MAALRIGEMFGSMMTVTEGAFALKPITEPTANASLGAACLLQRRRPAADRGRALRHLALLDRPAGRGRILGQCLRSRSAETCRASLIHLESRTSRLAFHP